MICQAASQSWRILQHPLFWSKLQFGNLGASWISNTLRKWSCRETAHFCDRLTRRSCASWQTIKSCTKTNVQSLCLVSILLRNLICHISLQSSNCISSPNIATIFLKMSPNAPKMCENPELEITMLSLLL